MKKMPNENILVSIRCLVYNHEPFLKKCLDGFIMQKTNFRFEAIVHDDASTDGSAEIIREYAERYPDIIKPIYETENQYSKIGFKVGFLFDKIMSKDTKYIATCEGDDYWTDPNKLQRQFDFLESHDDYSLITERSVTIFSLKNNKRKYFGSFYERDISRTEIAIKRQFTTASTMYKYPDYKEYQDFISNYAPYDSLLWLFLSLKGKVKYIPVVSSVYYRGVQGVTENNRAKFLINTAIKRRDDIEELFVKPGYIKKWVVDYAKWALIFRTLKKISKDPAVKEMINQEYKKYPYYKHVCFYIFSFLYYFKRKLTSL